MLLYYSDIAGATIYSKEARIGSLTKLIIDHEKGVIEGMLIRIGFLKKLYIPFDAVREIGHGKIFIGQRNFDAHMPRRNPFLFAKVFADTYKKCIGRATDLEFETSSGMIFQIVAHNKKALFTEAVHLFPRKAIIEVTEKGILVQKKQLKKVSYKEEFKEKSTVRNKMPVAQEMERMKE